MASSTPELTASHNGKSSLIGPLRKRYWRLSARQSTSGPSEPPHGWAAGGPLHDLPTVSLSQNRLRQLPLRLRGRSQLRCGGSTARDRVLRRGGRREEHA